MCYKGNLKDTMAAMSMKLLQLRITIVFTACTSDVISKHGAEVMIPEIPFSLPHIGELTRINARGSRSLNPSFSESWSSRTPEGLDVSDRVSGK